MKVALVYDRVNKWGGAERVLLALHELFPDAPLFTSVYHPEKAVWAKDFSVETSFLQNFPLASTTHEIYALLMPLAFEQFSFDTYDVVISMTSEAAKGIITKPQTTHICYALTPTRYLWSGFDEYFANPLLRAVAGPMVSYLRSWDIQASKRPDIMVSISKEVQKRVAKYYNRQAEIIYPPLMLQPSKKEKVSPGSYFLTVSRLVPYKRIDLAIRVCNTLKLPLKIVGSGSEEKYLKSIAGPTIEFVGSLTDEKLLRYYKDCIALIFPGYEDFGLAIVEAQGAGKPVVAFRKGGAIEIIDEGKTGIFFSPQEPKALIAALIELSNVTIRPQDCRERAMQFGKERFKQEFRTLVEKAVRERSIV